MGTAYESESLILGVTIKGTNVVSKFDEDKEFELENQLGAISYRINFRLSRHNNKTKVACSTTLMPESKIFSYTIPLIKRLARRELQSDMQALKIAVEGHIE